jgi:hypothetical protein
MRHWPVSTAAAVLAATLAACGGDDGGSKPAPDSAVDAAPPAHDSAMGGAPGDTGVTPDMAAPTPDMTVQDAAPADATPPDAAPPDAAVNPDMAVMDAAVDAALPDAVVDAAPPPVLDAGPGCMLAADAGPGPDPGDPACGEHQSCVDGACRPDLRPTVYRMIDGEVLAPENAGPALRVALLAAVDRRDLNLLFEPAGYGDAGAYRFYIGSGDSDVNNDDVFDGQYAWRHDLPIQAVDGQWHQDQDGPVFLEEGAGAGTFNLNVPVGRVENADGEMVDCHVRIPVATQAVHVRPTRDADGNEQLAAEVLGYMLMSDVDQIEVTFNGQPFRLAQFLQNDPPDVDSDGDGMIDAYSFHLTVVAEPVVFEDANPAREPDPPDPDDPACHNR